MMERVSRRHASQMRLGRTSPSSLLLIILFLIPFSLASEINSTCAPGLDTAGVTLPRGDILLEEGDPLNISCVLDLKHKDAIGRNSSDLVFYRNKEEVSKEFVTVKDSRTLQLFVKEMPASTSMFYCRLRSIYGIPNEKSVCLNKVDVGYKPQEVHNFTCTSHNWQSLTCTWVPPQNYLKTTYTLKFRLPGRAGGRTPHRCPDDLDIRENKCFWNSSTTPQYRQPYEHYYFEMIGSNVFGNISTNIKFYHYAHVKPAEPEKLMVINKTTNSILLQWHLPYPLQVFPPGLVQRVEYQHQWESRTKWEVANTSLLNIQDDSHIFNLTNLKYAHTLYDIRVYMKSAVALGDDMWSKPATLTERTDSTVPGFAPKTDVGSFEVAGGLPLRDVYVYWQQIPDYLHNGKYFEYKVIKVKENGITRDIVPHEVSKAYAKFKGLSFNSYTFTIVSANSEGYSLDSSVVYIPSRLESPGEPLSFTKIAFGDGVYELSWKHPKDHDKILNYTIFWCNNERDRPYQCMGYLNWTHVSKDIQIINITVPEEKIYQFAISANALTASSGMVWASCTVIHNKAVGKMKSVWINRSGSTFIEVGWKLECSDRIGLVQGYRIYYCPISSPHNVTCKEPERNTTFDSGKMHGRINNLKPYTTYMVAVSVLTKSGEGLQSDPLYNTTFEGAPDTPPTNLTVTDVTNTTMKVSWLPPVSMNGVLRYFEVFYNDKSLKVENKELHVTLENLKSYTTYNVSVAACTVSCSMKSAPVIVRTLVGIPGTMDRPSVNFVNSSQVQVFWQPPIDAAGVISYYELKVGGRDGQNPPGKPNYQISYGLNASLSVPDCEIEGFQISTFAVRAVNIAPENIYRGNWSEIGEANCFNTRSRRELQIWVPVGIGILLGFVGLAYCGKKVWAKFKKMQDVQVKLPSGLEQPKDKDPEIFNWPRDPFTSADSDHRPKKPGVVGAADEQWLLQQKERHGRNPSGDSRESSGCSSATDSVSSAITSGTQISSDSGADMDRCPTPDIMFRKPGDNHLRLRNVPQAASSSLSSDLTDIGGRSVGDIHSGQGKESPKQSCDYLRFAVAENTDSPQPVGYVSLESVTTPSMADAEPDAHYHDGNSSMTNSNYVSHPDIWLRKETSPLNPVLTENNETGEDEERRFVAPDSYCRMGWRPGTEHSEESEPVARFPERPSMSEPELVQSQASEGYVAFASLGTSVRGIPTSTRCHTEGVLPNQDCGVDEEDVSDCSAEPSSIQGHVTSPGYVALGYFTKEDGMCNSRHDAMEPHGGGSSPTSTNNHSLTNEES